MSDPIVIIEPSEVDTLVIIQPNEYQTLPMEGSIISDIVLSPYNETIIEIKQITPDNVIVVCCDDEGGGVVLPPTDIESLTTTETDDTKFLKPDGLGGVEWVLPVPVVPVEFNSFETVSKNIKAWNYSLNYAVSNLTSIVYTSGLDSITKTFNYIGPDVTSIVLSGSTPSGISLTKTLGYSLGKLTTITYS